MSEKIGIITNNRHQVFQRDIVQGCEWVAQQRNAHVHVDSIAEDPTQRQPIRLPIDELDGLIVIANVLSDDELQHLYARCPKMTLVSHHVKELPIPAVTQNNTNSMQQLVKHLVTVCNSRRIVFIQGDMNQHDGRARDYIFRQNLLRYDLAIAPHHLLRGDFDPKIAAQSIRALLRQDRDFDAVVASDYLMAVAALNELREANLKVPEDVCVVGFGDGKEAISAGLTTVSADIVELGQRAAHQLFAQIEGTQIEGITWLNANLIIRQTCCGHANL
jgi:DNA-binding LacI/PurR family transcriptional regulator